MAEVHPMLRCACGRIAVHFGLDTRTHKRVGLCAKCYDNGESKDKEERLLARTELIRDGVLSRMGSSEGGYSS